MSAILEDDDIEDLREWCKAIEEQAKAEEAEGRRKLKAARKYRFLAKIVRAQIGAKKNG